MKTGIAFDLSFLLGKESSIPQKHTRDYKGISLLNLTKDYTVIDIETTGLDPMYDEIIEIGAIKVRNNAIIKKLNLLIKPQNEVDEYITELTGISNDMLKDKPNIEKVISDFISFVGDDILIGHNVNFDINFLYDNCLKKGYYLKNDFIDTMRISRRINKDMKHHRLSDLISLYNINIENEHRALDDCQTTYEIYLKMYNEIIDKYSTVEEFVNTNKKHHSISAKQIVIEQTNVLDIDNPIYGKEIVFTGILSKFTRKDAMQLVANLGGNNRDTVTKDTNYLVLGNNDYCKTIKDGKSSKQKKAEKYKLKGRDIEIISENVFYEMIDNYIKK